MSKKRKQGRVIGRRRDGIGDLGNQVADIVFFGPPELRSVMLDQVGGLEALRQMLHDACPICSAGGRHDQGDQYAFQGDAGGVTI